MRFSKDGWILIILFVLLCIGGYFAAAPEDRPEILVSTTWNPDPNGVKAFYTLLGDKLGYNVRLLKSQYTTLPENARLLIVVQPGHVTSKNAQPMAPDIDSIETDALHRWVSKGGVVIFLSDNLDGVPAAFGSTQSIGSGKVYAYSSKDVITNRGMRNHNNALDLLQVMNKHIGKRDLILFDEYHHGEAKKKTIWSCISRQAWIAIAIILSAIGIMCYSYGRRFGAVRSLPESETLRPGYEFVESVAGLYKRAHATDIALDVLCRSFKHNLCARLGMPSDAPRQDIIHRLNADANEDIAEKVNDLIRDCEKYTAGHRLSEQELLLMAKKIHELEKELGFGSING